MKKIWLIGLALIFMLMLAACSGQTTDSAPQVEQDTLEHSEDPAQNEPQPEDVPLDTGEPVEEAQPPEQKIDIENIVVEAEANYYDISPYNMELILTASDRSTGEVLWRYTTPQCVQAQLETAEYLGVKNGLVYVNQQNIYDEATGGPVQGALVALDVRTGNIVWENSAFSGCSIRWLFGDDGTLYIGGFFGPDCMAIDPNGKTLWVCQAVNPDWYWPSDMQFDGDRIAITFTGSDNGEEIHVGYIGLDGTVQ